MPEFPPFQQQCCLAARRSGRVPGFSTPEGCRAVETFGGMIGSCWPCGRTSLAMSLPCEPSCCSGPCLAEGLWLGDSEMRRGQSGMPALPARLGRRLVRWRGGFPAAAVRPVESGPDHSCRGTQPRVRCMHCRPPNISQHCGVYLVQAGQRRVKSLCHFNSCAVTRSSTQGQNLIK